MTDQALMYPTPDLDKFTENPARLTRVNNSQSHQTHTFNQVKLAYLNAGKVHPVK